jgi:23S rRNA (cytidine1920-2'-O)/16S rRNA (cytidine1409-2'-O)-methyltransferase
LPVQFALLALFARKINEMRKERLDQILLTRGLADSLSQAQKLVMAGQVRVDNQLVFQPGIKFLPGVAVSIDHGPRFVSRGGEKLEAALLAFGLQDLAGAVCVDVGASTGGFSDCLLQHGAGKVYAVDVGYGELHWKLRNDPRVVVMERTNARHLDEFPHKIDLISIDASFISLKVLLPVTARWLSEQGGRVVALIKPQFEASRQEVSRGEGVIFDPEVHRQVLVEILAFAASSGYAIQGLIRSPLKGPKGNTEFLTCLAYPGLSEQNLPALIASVIESRPGPTSQDSSTGKLF